MKYMAWDDDEPLCPNLEVDDSKKTNTGLVDAKGRPLYRVQAPIGFGRDKER